MSGEGNKQLVVAYVDAFNRGDLDGLCCLFAPDAEIHGAFGSAAREKAREIWQQLIDCLNIQLQINAIIAEGDSVAVRYTERGKSVKAFRGAGPTGKSYEIAAMEWFDISAGLIHRRWGTRDTASQFRQMGLSLT